MKPPQAVAAVAMFLWASVELVAVGPAWAGPDQLAFVAASAGGQDLYVVDVNRSTAMRLAQNLVEGEGLVWSPDGAQLAFAAKTGATSAISVVRSDGSGLRQLVAGRGPSWSPDGTQIAFAAIQDGDE